MKKFRRSDQALASVVDPCIRAATSADRAQLVDFLSRLSPTSSYQRFLTGITGTPSERLLAALLPERSAGGALLAFLDGELVGHGLWVRLRDSSVAEIAIVVSDRHQRRGIGTALVSAVTEDLVAEGVADIEVFSSTDNRAVARMVSRAAPEARRKVDGSTMTWNFPALGRSSVLPRTA
jgi:GNAT superfamily N-acetyltransferase